jgi:peroxiredoxin
MAGITINNNTECPWTHLPNQKTLLGKLDKKKVPTICCLQETQLIDRNNHWFRMKGWKKIYQANGPSKQAIVAILTSDKIDFKFTLVK